MQKIIETTQISEQREKEVYEMIESVIGTDYDSFSECWKEWGLWLWGIFIDFWRLKAQWKEKAIELHKQLFETHWKIASDKKLELNKKNKIAEIKINKINFCTKYKLDPDREQIYKVKEFEIEDDKIIIIWCTRISQEMATCFWGTTLILQKETPELYEDVIKKYHWYYE